MPAGSKTVTYSKNLHSKKHKTHKDDVLAAISRNCSEIWRVYCPWACSDHGPVLPWGVCCEPEVCLFFVSSA